jgi:hypothetical protein
VAVTFIFVSMPAVARAQSNGAFPEPAAPPSAPPPAPGYAPAAPVFTPPPAAAPAPPTAPAPTTYAPPAATPYTPPQNPTLPAYQPAAPSGLESLPPLLPYKQGLPVPAGYRVVDRGATGLTIGGGLTFAAAYVAALGLAASQGFDNGTAYTAIPVAGPWAAIGGRSFSCKVAVSISVTSAEVQKSLNKCVGQAFDEVTTVVFLTADGLIQATGAVLFFVGLGSGYQELVRADLPKTAIYAFPEGGGGLSVSGNF